MPSQRQVAEFWAGKALETQYQMLEAVRSSAGKWAAAIAAALGIYTTVGFVWGPDKLAALPSEGIAKVIVLSLMGLAGLTGIGAVILANLAAQGLPTVFYDRPITGPELMQHSAIQARTAHHQLVSAIRLAAVAAVCIVSSSVWLLGAALAAPTAPIHAVVINSSKAVCGTLTIHDEGVALRLASNQTIGLSEGGFMIVPSCPR